MIGDTWLIRMEDYVNYVTVSRDGRCVPLTGHYYFHNPHDVNTLIMSDFMPQINDLSIFNVPDICKTEV
ncbi:unnamed protein product [Rotaria sordida]|nr:unnamed protein product [Rotaria sordida]CAF4049430.1 unnamed protein product [Rotaria sordida]CAF4174075.1 unnamed protein product [Rotaria sordida]